MSNIKLVKMTLHTGYVGATHESEFELDVEGLTEAQIENIIEEELELFMQKEIGTEYEIIDMED